MLYLYNNNDIQPVVAELQSIRRAKLFYFSTNNSYLVIILHAYQ